MLMEADGHYTIGELCIAMGTLLRDQHVPASDATRSPPRPCSPRAMITRINDVFVDDVHYRGGTGMAMADRRVMQSANLLQSMERAMANGKTDLEREGAMIDTVAKALWAEVKGIEQEQGCYPDDHLALESLHSQLPLKLCRFLHGHLVVRLTTKGS